MAADTQTHDDTNTSSRKRRPRRRHPLLRVSLANLLAHKVRLALTVLSVVLGTAFISASLVFTATLESSISQVFDNSMSKVDIRISTEDSIAAVPIDVWKEVADDDAVAGTRPVTIGGVMLLDKEGEASKDFSTNRAIATGLYENTGDLDSDRTMVKGRLPQRDDEVVLGEKLAAANGYELGDEVQFISSQGGVEKARLVGLDKLENDPGVGEILFTESRALKILTNGDAVAGVDIDVKNNLGEEGVQKLKKKLQKAYPDYQVQTGAEVAEEINSQLQKSLNFFNYFLLAFGIIALVVGTFLIYNTFAMIVAQRIRELALLRAIGTTRGQVVRSVLGEAAIVGTIGSAIGLGVGVGLAFGLAELMAALGMPLTETGLSLPWTAFVIPMVLGILVTLVSAWVPARRAGKTPPVQAMLQDSTTAVGSLKIRTIIGVLALLAGIGVVVFGGLEVEGKMGLLTVGVGALAMILGLFLAGPAMSTPAMKGLGLFLRPLPSYKTTGKIAVRNALRSPVRTATTSFALTLGLLLVSMVGVMGSSTQASINNIITGGLKTDFVLTVPQGMGIPKQFAPDMSDMVGVQDASTIYYGFTEIDSERMVFTTADQDVSNLVNFEVLDGKYDIDGESLMVSEDYAKRKNVKAGSKLEVETQEGTRKIPIAGVYARNAMLQEMVVTYPLYEKIMPPSMQFALFILIKSNGMYDQATMKAQLQNAVAKLKIIQVATTEEFSGEQAELMNGVLAGLYALLALSVIIAILGVINTLALSVTERRQEIGMLRAIGMAREQLRHMFYLESILLSIFGTVLGTATGTLVGWALSRAMVPYGLVDVLIPWQMILGVLVGSIVVGVIAALGPAARAAKISPLKAIAD
ncbi:MAG: FtsX-like permease family protein [Lawsonella sp.]